MKIKMTEKKLIETTTNLSFIVPGYIDGFHCFGARSQGNRSVEQIAVDKIK